MEQEFVKILGVDVPHIIIPVRPGRDLARLIEVAAFQIKLKSVRLQPGQGIERPADGADGRKHSEYNFHWKNRLARVQNDPAMMSAKETRRQTCQASANLL
jgi:hypothetical protein